MPSPFALTDRRALITGGGTGIGPAIARVFVEFGAPRHSDRTIDGGNAIGF